MSKVYVLREHSPYALYQSILGVYATRQAVNAVKSAEHPDADIEEWDVEEIPAGYSHGPAWEAKCRLVDGHVHVVSRGESLRPTLSSVVEGEHAFVTVRSPISRDHAEEVANREQLAWAGGCRGGTWRWLSA